MELDLDNYDMILGVPFKGVDKILQGRECLWACREDQALAIAFGAHLAGKKPIVLMQNSGLGLCGDVITSLLIPSGVRIPLVIYNRKTPDHHKKMGEITKDLLKLFEYEDAYIYEEGSIA